jgi:hypothetical protein
MLTTTTKKTSTKKTNVDVDYNKHIKEFNEDFRQLPSRRKHLKQLTSKYDLLCKKNLNEMSDDEINELHRTKTEIDTLLNDINDIEQLNKVTDFYLKTGELLIDYYENNEKKDDTKPDFSNENHQNSSYVPTLLKFFGKKAQEGTNTQTTQDKIPTNQFTGRKNCSQRADICEQYLSRTDPHHITGFDYNKADDFCHKCNVYRELVPAEAILVCPKCGDEVQTIMEADKPSYRDPPHENMYFAYKRINHFKEQLAHFQAKETTKIPQEIYDAILVEFKKEKKTDLSALTRACVKKYLQKYSHLGYNKYYENINQIICHLNGIQPFYMKPEVEEQLCNMFQKIQEPFEKHCPLGRTNFLSYEYVIYKFCQLLGYNEYLPYFRLLKSKDKLRQQDKIWKNICSDLGWEFHPSSY